MSDWTWVEAVAKIEAWGNAITEAQLRDIVEDTSVAQLDGSTPPLTVLYSGPVDVDRLEWHSSALANQIAALNDGADGTIKVGIIDNTHAGKLVKTPAFDNALGLIFKDNEAGLNSFLYDTRATGTPGIWDVISDKLVRSTGGDFITISPGGLMDRTLAATEVPALLASADGRVNGVHVSIFRDIHDLTLREALLAGKALDVAETLARERTAQAINASSANVWHNTVYVEDAIGTRTVAFGDALDRTGIHGLRQPDLPDGTTRMINGFAELGGYRSPLQQLDDLVAGSRLLKQMGVAGTAIGLAVTAGLVAERMEADDRAGAVQVIGDFVASELGAAAGGALGAAATMAVARALLVPLFGLTGVPGLVVAGAIMGSIGAGGLTSELFNQYFDDEDAAALADVMAPLFDAFADLGEGDAPTPTPSALDRAADAARDAVGRAAQFASPIVLDLDGDGVETAGTGSFTRAANTAPADLAAILAEAA